MFNGIVYIGRLERRGNQAMDTWRSVLSENAFLFVGDLNNFAKVCFFLLNLGGQCIADATCSCFEDFIPGLWHKTSQKKNPQNFFFAEKQKTLTTNYFKT